MTVPIITPEPPMFALDLDRGGRVQVWYGLSPLPWPSDGDTTFLSIGDRLVVLTAPEARQLAEVLADVARA